MQRSLGGLRGPGAAPVAPGAFDVAISVFGVIFASEPAAAVGQMLGALRPGGVLVIASWIGRGPVHEASALLRAAFPAVDGAPRVDWADPDWVRCLVAEAGAREITQQVEDLTWEAASPEASIAALRAGSDDAPAFRAHGSYAITRAVR